MDFPNQEFELLRREVDKFIEEHCEHPHQVELFMMALVKTIKKTKYIIKS